MSSAASAGVVAAAAAEQKLRRDEEEEKMSDYTAGDMHGWEFKIVRANMASFKNRETLNKVIAEEAQAGWEFLEKFDDARLRFKRKTEERKRDATRTIDPYRTVYGVSAAWTFVIIFGIVVAMVVFSMLFAYLIAVSGY